MSKINNVKVLLGGLAAGIVLNIVDYLVNGMWLEPQWTAAAAKLNPSLNAMSGASIAGYIGADFVFCLVIVWLYAAMRPRFGPGAGTAMKAAAAVWVVDAAIGATFVLGGLYPAQLVCMSLVASLVGMLAASYVGGMLYSE